MKTSGHTRSFTGCKRCKVRKQKCDEKTPSCSRCLKAGVSCEYQEMTVRVFNVSTTSRSRKSSQTLADEAISNPTILTKPVAIDYTELGASLFLQQNAHFGRYCGLNESLKVRCLVPTLKILPPSSPAHAALRAFSTHALAVSHRDSALYQLSLKAKAGALQHLRHSLRERTPVTEILTSIFLFCLLESSSSEDPDRGAAHFRALLEVTRNLLTPEIIADNQHEYMFAVAIHQTALHNILRGTRAPLPIESATFDLERWPHNPDNPVFLLANMTTKTSYLCDRLTRLSSPEQVVCDFATSKEVLDLYVAAKRLFTEVESHNGKLLPIEMYHTGSYKLTTANVDTSDVYPGRLCRFASAELASTFVWMACTKIVILHICIRCLLLEITKFQATNSPRTAELITELHAFYAQTAKVVDDICATIPFFLSVSWQDLPDELSHLRSIRVEEDMAGTVGPSNIMYVASYVGVIPDLQRRWLRARYRAITGSTDRLNARALAFPATYPLAIMKDIRLPSDDGIVSTLDPLLTADFG